MAQSIMRRGRMLGEYLIGRQIGSGSFSVVWHGRHCVHGTEVAIKEIAMGRLNKKLQESLLSEIVILKKINHPNIIRLYDIIEVPGKIHLVLEYCKGGDLSMYIKHHGRVQEESAKYFMQQLAAGLQILRDNNLIHRDLKPQNLLLSEGDNNSILKIADFGFARSLQPMSLAETMCGSPLYMAPEIMQLQKYDAKADLWSVGVILFQLVTGKPPFTGNTQFQLLQNILKSTELCFPPDSIGLSSDCKDLCYKLLRSNPVERITFEEFFNHPLLHLSDVDTEGTDNVLRAADGSMSPEYGRLRNMEACSQEDCMPFFLEDYPGDLDTGRAAALSSTRKPNGETEYKQQKHKEAAHENKSVLSQNRGQRPSTVQLGYVDSLDLIVQDYVFVSGPTTDTSSLSTSAPKPSLVPCSVDSQGSVPTADIRGSAGTFEKSFGNHAERIRLLRNTGHVITELVAEKMDMGKKLEALAIQLVNLATWKQVLHILNPRVGNPFMESGSAGCRADSLPLDSSEITCSLAEREFLSQVDLAEELVKVIDPRCMEMPDAMELIFEAALAFGKLGAVDELMGDIEKSESLYSKSVQLLRFLLVEAPLLALTPPFSVTEADRCRIRTYIDILEGRRAHTWSEKAAAGFEHLGLPALPTL